MLRQARNDVYCEPVKKNVTGILFQEKITDKDENSSSNNLGKNDNVDAKEQRQPNPHKAEPRAQETADDDEDVDEDSADDDDGDDQNDEDDSDDDHHLEPQHSSKRPPADSCEANLENGGKEDENLKLKKRFDIPLVKHYGAGAKDRDEKKGGERKATGAEKKAGDKASPKTSKAKRLKGVEKKAGKMQASEEHQRTKRSLKEKVKDMVHKLKGAATPHPAEGDKKKRLTAEELSKVSAFI